MQCLKSKSKLKFKYGSICLYVIKIIEIVVSLETIIHAALLKGWKVALLGGLGHAGPPWVAPPPCVRRLEPDAGESEIR